MLVGSTAAAATHSSSPRGSTALQADRPLFIGGNDGVHGGIYVNDEHKFLSQKPAAYEKHHPIDVKAIEELFDDWKRLHLVGRSLDGSGSMADRRTPLKDSDLADFRAVLRAHRPGACKAELLELEKIAMEHHTGVAHARKAGISDAQLEKILQHFRSDAGGIGPPEMDGDGRTIDLHSFMRASRILADFDVSEAERRRLFHKYDADGNGEMDVAEFRAMMNAEPAILAYLDLVCDNMKRISMDRRRASLGIQRRTDSEEDGGRQRRPSLADISIDAEKLKSLHHGGPLGTPPI